jgi:hypothetical protein
MRCAQRQQVNSILETMHTPRNASFRALDSCLACLYASSTLITVSFIVPRNAFCQTAGSDAKKTRLVFTPNA